MAISILRIRIKKLHPDASVPRYAHGPEEDAGMDLRALERVVRRCLEKEPDHRYQDAASLEKALAACECTGQWTTERAEEWWRGRGIGTVLPSHEKARTSDQQTVPAVFNRL